MTFRKDTQLPFYHYIMIIIIISDNYNVTNFIYQQ